jgi:flagellar hook-associated protein 3 FlgL
MTITRVTTNLLVNRTLDNLNAQQRRLFRLQQQLATGQRVNVPSDDPLAARRAVEGRTNMAKNSQYVHNISMAGLFMNETEISLLTLVDRLQRVNELGLQAANQVNADLQLDQISQEINQILESILDEANEISNGRYLFAGTRTLERPFVETRNADGDIVQVDYLGNNESIFVEIDEDVNVRINETGQTVFRQTTVQSVDIFEMMINLRDNLRNEDRPALQDRLEEISTSISQVLIAVARVGSVQNRLERTEENLRANNLQLQQFVSDAVDADFAEVTLNLNIQLNAFQAALNAGARVIQPSLMDFLR